MSAPAGLRRPDEARADAVATVRAVRRRGRARATSVAAGLSVVLLALAVVTACLGGFTVSFVDVVRIIGGADIPGATFIVHEVRLPRLLTGLGAGAAFGVSGAIFQTLVRNPLASPDIIGITAGASAAAVFAITQLGLNPGHAAPFAIGGAFAAAALIYGLAWRGAVSGQRLILVGIGIAAVLGSVTSWSLTRAEVTDASEALVWITGSLNGSTWSRLPLLWWPLLVLLPPRVSWASGCARSSSARTPPRGWACASSRRRPGSSPSASASRPSRRQPQARSPSSRSSRGRSRAA